MRPEIATTLADGTYGQREMTEEEHTQYLEAIKEPEEETIEE